MAAAGVFLITAIALFVPPYIGMADNGDYFRVLYSNGLYFNAPDYDSQYLGYFVKEYEFFNIIMKMVPLYPYPSLYLSAWRSG
ncbi:hypothetical protein ABNC92_05550 [Paenibacillus larvae]